MKILAVLAGYNESSIILHVLQHLVDNYIDTFYIDNGSTDGTLELVKRSGLCIDAISLPRNDNKYEWRKILQRKESIYDGFENKYDWFMHHDCDEFRYSPYPGMTLAQAICHVDDMEYTAIDHVLFDMQLTENVAEGDDPRGKLIYCKPPEKHHNFQVKTWKNTGSGVNISKHGGHWPIMDDLDICLRPFVMAHYPLRNVVQAKRKVFEERLPCYIHEEHKVLAWHEPWDEYKADPNKSFVVDPKNLYQFSLQKARYYCRSI